MGFQFAARDAVAPVMIDEIAQILPATPLAFRRVGHAADKALRYQLVAVQSLAPGSNVFVHPDGRWLGRHIPAHYRGYPFRLMPVQGGGFVFSVDVDSELFLETGMPGSFAIFESPGRPSAEIKRLMEFHEQLEQRRRVTQRAVDTLQKNGLIQPWCITLEGESKRLSGLFRIDEEALAALATTELSELHAAGSLPVAYGQLFSQHCVANLHLRYRHWQMLVSEQQGVEA